MRVLWFEVTMPSAYGVPKAPIGGWQDSLERIVKTVPDIELVVAFMSGRYSEVKVVDGVTYVPINANWTHAERLLKKYWNVYVEKMLPTALRIIKQYKPDLIHIFGTEWPFGQIAAYTNIPVVIHIMGSIAPYKNADFPPGYSYRETLCLCWWNPSKLFLLWKNERDKRNREQWELSTWKLVDNYMGRTQWDCSLSRIMHPKRSYFHVEEALRPIFLSGIYKWAGPKSGKIKLISTGIGSFWKGPDMMLKVAHILTMLGIDFVWNVAGVINNSIKQLVEKKEGYCFEDCHLNILGYIQPEELVEKLCASTMYIHTAYIENSPNSICEAQSLGVPVISTNVGGIASLVRHDIDGVLVAANDPWQMADAIIELANDPERMLRYSNDARTFALKRHNDENIKKQLLNCYSTVIKDFKDEVNLELYPKRMEKLAKKMETAFTKGE